MATYFQQPITLNDLKSEPQEQITFDWWKDFKGGFETENLPTMLYQHMSDNSDFVPEDNKEELIKICGHYVLSDKKFLEIKPNIDIIIKSKIKNKLGDLFNV